MVRSALSLALFISGLFLSCNFAKTSRADHVRDLQTAAVKQGEAAWGHWGADPGHYSTWFSHSNRLIPVYTFGIKLDAVRGEKSLYRDANRIKELYGFEPQQTLNPTADYFDQTDVARLQKQAAAAGKKYIVLIVFDGMDWHTTHAAAVQSAGRVGYTEGRGTGLQFQDYKGVETDYGWFVTSPHDEGTKVDVNTQQLINPGGNNRGGFAWQIAGVTPWARASDPAYYLGKGKELKQAYTDSASSATSLCSGIKTYNDSINVDAVGRQVESVARVLQKQGFSIGVVTSVPISHATPSCAYANNVHRDDYQDLTRDLLGLPSITHPREPLPGVDVLIGGGWGASSAADRAQGTNFVPGNVYITEADLAASDVSQSKTGRYRISQRTAGVTGRTALQTAAQEAAQKNERLFGFYGIKSGHLPFQTADGKYDPTRSGKGAAEVYTPADVDENPTLADFTRAALTVLSTNKKGFWLMIESGDVDWANHANNIDNSIGAVKSGDAAFQAVCDWMEANKAWDESAVIITSDHGHYFFLEKPEALLNPQTEVTAH